MVGIEVNNTFLDLGDEGIRFEKINPSFITDLFQGDFSFPFTAPDTDNNLKALGFSNIIELVNRILIFDCYIWMFGMPYTKGKIIVSAGTAKTIKLNLTMGIKAMKIADKSLKDLNYGDNFLLGVKPETRYANIKEISLNTDYKVFPFTFIPHKNEDFYGSSNTDFCGIINRQNSVTGDFLKNNATSGSRYSFVPFLYLFFILKKIFEEEGLIPIGDFWNDTEMQKILMYNNYALDSEIDYFDDNCYVYTDSNHDYITIEKVQFIKGLSGTYDAANLWSNSLYEYTILQAGDITIDVYIAATVSGNGTPPNLDHPFGFDVFIDGVQINGANDLAWPWNHRNYDTKSSTYSYTATIADIGKKIYVKSKNILNALSLELSPGSSLAIYNTSDPYSSVDKTITFKNHIKDISVSDFLSIFKNAGVQITFDYNKKFVYLNYDKDYIKAKSFDDWTNKATDDYEINFEDYKKGYKVNYDFGSADLLIENNFKNFDKNKYLGSILSIKFLPISTEAGQTILILNSNKLYISIQNTNGIGFYWEFFCDNYYDIILDKGQTESKCKLAPMFMDYADNEGGTADENRCLIPISKQPGSSKMFGLGESDFDLRFMFLRGVNQSNSLVNPQGGNYIYAGTSIYGINSNQVGNYEFMLNSSNGLIDIFVLDFLKALSVSTLVERDILLNELDILNLNIKKKISIDGSNYILKSMSIAIANILKMSRAKMLKL